MLVTEPLCLTKTNAINDGSMVELIGNDGVLLVVQGLKNATIGIKCSHVQDCVLSTQKGRYLFFQLFMNILCTANKTYTAHAITPEVNVFFSSFNHLGM